MLVEFNQTWANKAPVLILTLAHTRFEKDGKPNRHAFYDLGQAAANLALQATELGLATHPMAGFNVEAARERFAVPEGWEPVSVIALGYPGEFGLANRKVAATGNRPAPSQAARNFCFFGRMGTPGADRRFRLIEMK